MPRADARGWLSRCCANLAVQDWLLLAYVTALNLAVGFGSGPERSEALLRVGADALFLVSGLALTRGALLRPDSLVYAFIYRAATFGVVMVSYFQLRQVLPAVTTRAVDESIYQLDLALFGFEPALAWDRFVNPVTTEWFAFFYFSYFLLLAVHVLPCLFCGKDGRMNARFALGAYFIFAAAHMIYMAVPGFGPYAHLRHEFQNPLDGGVFWPLVWTTVAESGALKDIFPSVHTAIPTYCVTFAILHRRQWPYGWVWPILLFWASQIVIATMFLRWHYLIDIVAGLTLAVASALASVRICEWEDGFRRREGLQPVFKPIWPRTEAVSQAEQA